MDELLLKIALQGGPVVAALAILAYVLVRHLIPLFKDALTAHQADISKIVDGHKEVQRETAAAFKDGLDRMERMLDQRRSDEEDTQPGRPRKKTMPMAILLAGLCLTCLVACGADVPGGGGPLVLTSVPKQDIAFELVRVNYIGLIEGVILKEPVIRWWQTRCPKTGEVAVVVNSTCYPGLYYRGAAEVAWTGSIGTTRYAHELMHHLLAIAGQDEDQSHKRKGLWDVAERASARLVELGL